MVHAWICNSQRSEIVKKPSRVGTQLRENWRKACLWTGPKKEAELGSKRSFRARRSKLALKQGFSALALAAPHLSIPRNFPFVLLVAHGALLVKCPHFALTHIIRGCHFNTLLFFRILQ